MCGRASTTRYVDVVDDVLQTILLNRANADGERTNSVEVLCEKGLNEVQGFENVSWEQKSILSLDEKAEQQNWED